MTIFLRLSLFSIESVTFPPRAALLFKALWCYVPERILPLVEYLPAQQLNVFRNYMRVARKVAKQLLAEKAKDLQSSKTQNKKDVMSLLGGFHIPRLFAQFRVLIVRCIL